MSWFLGTSGEGQASLGPAPEEEFPNGLKLAFPVGMNKCYLPKHLAIALGQTLLELAAQLKDPQ